MSLINSFSIRGAEQTYKTHDFSRSHQLKILDFNGVPDYVKKEFIDLDGRYYATSYSVPEMSVQNLTVPFQSFNFNIPGQIAFPGTYVINIKTAGSFLVRNACERWIHSLFSVDSSCGNFGFPCPDVTLSIGVMAPDCSFIRGYRFIGVYPQAVGQIQYNQENVELTNFDFTLQYQRWEPFDLNETIASDSPNQLDSVFESFESRIAAGVGTSCSNKTNIPRV
jgi:hypothetical protein